MQDIMTSLAHNAVIAQIAHNIPSLRGFLIFLSGDIIGDPVSGILVLFIFVLMVFLGLSIIVNYKQILGREKTSINELEMFRRIYNILALISVFAAFDLAIWRGVGMLMWVMFAFAFFLALGYPSVNYHYITLAENLSEDSPREVRQQPRTIFTRQQLLLFVFSIPLLPLFLLMFKDVRLSFFAVFFVQSALVLIAI